MRMDYQKIDNIWSYVHYNQFSVGSACEEYPLTVGGFTGEGTDGFAYHNGWKFSTPDNDNDRSKGNCAASYKSGWWCNYCHHFGINKQPPYSYVDNIVFTEIKIRPKNCITH